MEPAAVLPDAKLSAKGVASSKFLELGVTSFRDACRFVANMPYGYNSDRDDPMALFREGMGTCTTKHGVIATLAEETGLQIRKTNRVDLTEGNRNGKNGTVNGFLFSREVVLHFTEKDEYLLYRKVLTEQVLPRDEIRGVDLRTVLQARVEGLVLLRARLDSAEG